MTSNVFCGPIAAGQAAAPAPSSIVGSVPPPPPPGYLPRWAYTHHGHLTPVSDSTWLLITANPRELDLLWAQKVYTTVAEKRSTSNYYILGQRRDRTALYSAFKGACAGLLRDNTSYLQLVVNLQQIH